MRACGVPIGPVRCAAAVPRVARPSEAPICRELLRSPDAVPVSWGSTPIVVVETTGPRQRPKPTLAKIEGPKTSTAKVPLELIRLNHANPGCGEQPTADQEDPGRKAVAEF